MINKMNKKGVGPLVIPIILGAFLLVGIFAGWWTAYKINQTISSIPTWAWIAFIVIVLLLMFPKKK